MELQLLTLEKAEVLQEILGAAPSTSPDTIELSAEQKHTLLNHAQVKSLSAPRLALISGQEGQVVISTETAYVDSYRHYYVNGNALVEPTINVVQDGLVVDLRPTFDDTKSHCQIDLEFSVSKLHSLKDQPISVGESTVTIQLPEVSSQTVQASFTQRVGSYSLTTGHLKGRWLLLSHVVDPAKP